MLFILSSAFGTGQFGSLASLRIVAQQTMMGAAIALAMTCNMKNGRWDFSIGMMTVMSSVIGGAIGLALNIGAFGLLIGCILVALIASVLNGLLYITIKVPALVVSIGTMLVYESVILVFNKGSGARISITTCFLFGRSPYVFITGHRGGSRILLFSIRTRDSVTTRALWPCNQAACGEQGINEKRQHDGCYLLCGLMVGIAGTI